MRRIAGKRGGEAMGQRDMICADLQLIVFVAGQRPEIAEREEKIVIAGRQARQIALFVARQQPAEQSVPRLLEGEANTSGIKLKVEHHGFLSSFNTQPCQSPR
ncbi:hypothetical protein [Methylosinus sp. KRF6]|uniref:hypothetical protein n=1 Tax=Methylosinus sp. KRF6 TaxID=2846853 RepID=UPI00209B2123|nr:hypothetical protein [Methylosinus sp. KRF6]